MLLTYLLIGNLQGEPGPPGILGLGGNRGEPVSKNGF